jgi:5'-phosphate synthase pdxT subunit
MIPCIGILALQGAFLEHAQMLDRIGVSHRMIRTKEDFDAGVDALILPGGESTTMLKLLRSANLFDPIQAAIRNRMPVLGTCAGLILLSKSLSNDERRGFQTLDVVVRRNAYGRQLASHQAIADFLGIGYVPMTFIRAPLIESVGSDVRVLAKVDHGIVAVQEGNQLGLTFHPELDDDERIHRYFLSLIPTYMDK